MMDLINVGNISWYLLQAQEGNLSLDQMDALCLFLEENPEFTPEVDLNLAEFEHAYLSKSFKHLKKEELSLNAFEELALAVLDGEKSVEEIRIAMQNRTDLQTQWKAFEQTKLIPEAHPYPNKQLLFRQRVMPIWMRYAAAVCILAFVAGLAWLNITSIESIPVGIAGKRQSPINLETRSSAFDSIELHQDKITNQRITLPKPAIREISLQPETSPIASNLPTIEALHSLNNKAIAAEIPQLNLSSIAPTIQVVDFLITSNTDNADKQAILLKDLIQKILPTRFRLAPENDVSWTDALASAGNQSLEQISKGRIEFSYKPEDEKGADTYLKIGNFSISRSLASN
jgi:hypothetical protein